MALMKQAPYAQPHPGSSLYYALLKTPEPQRTALLSFRTLAQTLRTLVQKHKEPEVLAKTLDWWQSDLQHLFEGTPQHPLLQNLQPLCTHFKIPKTAFDALFQAILWDHTYQGYQSRSDIDTYLSTLGLAFNGVWQAVLLPAYPGSHEALERLAYTFQAIQLLRHSGQEARAGRIYFPLDELALYQLSAEDLLSREKKPEWTERFQAYALFWAKNCENSLQEALQDPLIPPLPREYRVVLTLAQALLKVIQKDPKLVSSHYVSLPALKKYGLSWLLRDNK